MQKHTQRSGGPRFLFIKVSKNRARKGSTAVEMDRFFPDSNLFHNSVRYLIKKQTNKETRGSLSSCLWERPRTLLKFCCLWISEDGFLSMPSERLLLLFVTTVTVKNMWFVGGDFNCTENPSLDRNHQEPQRDPPKGSQKALAGVMFGVCFTKNSDNLCGFTLRISFSIVGSTGSCRLFCTSH